MTKNAGIIPQLSKLTILQIFKCNYSVLDYSVISVIFTDMDNPLCQYWFISNLLLSIFMLPPTERNGKTYHLSLRSK